MKIAALIVLIVMVIASTGCGDPSTSEPQQTLEESVNNTISQIPPTSIENSPLTPTPTLSLGETITMSPTPTTPTSTILPITQENHLVGTHTISLVSTGTSVSSDKPSINMLRAFTWRLDALSKPRLYGGSPISIAPYQKENHPITLKFGENTIGGNAGCNDYGATYEINDGTLTISDLSSNAEGCSEPGIMVLEEFLLSSLPSSLSYELDSTILRILCSGSGVFVFEQIPTRIPVEIEPDRGNSFCYGDLVLIDVYVESDMSDQYYRGWDGETPVDVGDPYLVVRGQFKNESDTGYWVGHEATGYNIEGNVVAWTVDSAHIVGQALMGIGAHMTEEFEIHMNYADNLSLVRIGAFCSIEPPP